MNQRDRVSGTRAGEFAGRGIAPRFWPTAPGFDWAGSRQGLITPTIGLASAIFAVGAALWHVAVPTQAPLVAETAPGLVVVEPIEPVSVATLRTTSTTERVQVQPDRIDADRRSVDDKPSASGEQPLEATSQSEVGATTQFEAPSRPDVGISEHQDEVRETEGPTWQVVTVGQGDTLMQLLTGMGADRSHAHELIAALASHFDPRKLRAGQKIAVAFEGIDSDQRSSANAGELNLEVGELKGSSPQERLFALSIKPDVERTIEVELQPDGAYEGREVVAALDARPVRATGTIESSLFLSGMQANIPPAVIVEMIRMYSYNIDFQREIRSGDKFEVFFERHYDEHGLPVKEGDVLFASMTVRGKKRDLWRYEMSDGKWDYFDAKGQSMKKFLMRTPIDGARLSSRFGMRKHPILGYTKMHAGTDFAAPPGTPIYAAGDGTIEVAGWQGGYGKYIRIRHANGYKTAYAHMRGFARGMTKGKYVRQGQTIGYVGSTGRSTGPHLHYEVHRNGKKVNPMTIRVPTGKKLEGTELAAFQNARATIDAQIAQAPALTRLAEAQFETTR